MTQPAPEGAPALPAPLLNAPLADPQGRPVSPEVGFERIVESMPDAIVIVDQAGAIGFASAQAEKLFGYPRKEMLGQPVEMLLPERFRARHIGRRTSFFADPRVRPMGTNLDLCGRRRDGSEFPVEISLSPICPFVIAAVRDMTNRKRAEHALRAAESKYQSIFDNATDAIYIHNLQGRFTGVNRAGARLLGYTHEEFLRLTTNDIITPAHRLFAQEQTRRKLTGEAADTVYELQVRRKDGTLLTLEVNSQLICEGGQPIAVQGICRDVTERKRLEAERRKVEAHVQQAQKLESLGVVAGGIAHDFNNILAAILGNASLALMQVPPEFPGRGALEEIEKASLHGADLVRQMLAYAGKGRFHVQDVHLSRAVEEMAHLLQTVISKKVTLRLELADSLPMIKADASQIRQVIMNLITNASDALGDMSGVINVRTGVMTADRDYFAGTGFDAALPEGEYIFLEVQDTGCGMDAATQAKIFDPFFTTKFTGRGLGLAAVLGIVRGHCGAIKIDSQPNCGATFRVLFPSSDLVQDCSAHKIMVQRTETWRGVGTILVADDEEGVRNVARFTLEHQGFRVVVATDGREALDVFAQNQDSIRAVLLDLTMPKVGGEDVLEELRRLRPDIPVVITSGYTEREVNRLLAGKGLAGFLQKPFRASDLLMTIRQIIGHSPTE